MTWVKIIKKIKSVVGFKKNKGTKKKKREEITILAKNKI